MINKLSGIEYGLTYDRYSVKLHTYRGYKACTICKITAKTLIMYKFYFTLNNAGCFVLYMHWIFVIL